MASARTPRTRLDATAYDVVIFGGGSAGIAAAEGAAAAGAQKIAIIEEDRLGGECPWWSCVPSKAGLKSVKVFRDLQLNAGRFGIRSRGITADFGAIAARRDAVVHLLTGSGKRLPALVKSLGVRVVSGRGHFLEEHEVVAHGTKLQAKAFVIATGSEEILPPISGLETVPYWTHRDVARLQTLPRSLVIIGAGPVGVEYATYFSGLGVPVTILQRSDRILSRTDEELALLASDELRKRGVKIITKSTVLAAAADGRSINLTYQVGRKPRQVLSTDHVLIAAGRRPSVNGLGLDRLGISLEDIYTGQALDDYQRSEAKHVFFAGDAAGGLQFTHVAHRGGWIAGWNAANVSKPRRLRKIDHAITPGVTFTDPEFASVGLTGEQAVAKKKKIRVFKASIASLGRALTDGATTGMCKVVVDAKTDLILGAHMLGERAGEVIHEVALAMRFGITMSELQDVTRAYPTYSEILSVVRE